MLQLMELSAGAVADGESEETTQAISMEEEEDVTVLEVKENSQKRAAAAASAKSKTYRIINATTSGPAYNPTPAQILAAEMAEEFYGTKVTFVHADVMTFKQIVQEQTGNGNGFEPNGDHGRTSSTTVTNHKQNTSCARRVQKSTTTFKQRAKIKNSRNAEPQRLQLRDASPSLPMHYGCAGSSSMPSPVSPLGVFNEFENCSSGDGGQGSADTQAHDYMDSQDRGSDENESRMGDGGFTFPSLFMHKETTVFPRPKLLHLFPEAPNDHN